MNCLTQTVVLFSALTVNTQGEEEDGWAGADGDGPFRLAPSFACCTVIGRARRRSLSVLAAFRAVRVCTRARGDQARNG